MEQTVIGENYIYQHEDKEANLQYRLSYLWQTFGLEKPECWVELSGEQAKQMLEDNLFQKLMNHEFPMAKLDNGKYYLMPFAIQVVKRPLEE
jgi:hypothetical protein